MKADEGMWLPLLIKRLNEADMQKEGLKLTAEEIYSVNNASMKTLTSLMLESVLAAQVIIRRLNMVPIVTAELLLSA